MITVPLTITGVGVGMAVGVRVAAGAGDCSGKRTTSSVGCSTLHAASKCARITGKNR
jgi:hypothetical protein